jgi:diguanylate cyclase (GGDEF)-like protein
LDTALRLDGDFELIRVVHPLDAIGELANPIDAESPSQAVVVLAPEVALELLTEGAGGIASSGLGGMLEFVGALRRIDPFVHVLASRRPGPDLDARAAGMVDAVVEATDSPERIRDAIRGVARAQHGARAATSTAVPPVARQVASESVGQVPVAPVRPAAGMAVDSMGLSVATGMASGPGAAVQTGGTAHEPMDLVPLPEPPDASTPVVGVRDGAAAVGDGVLADLVTRGRDPLPAALAILRERLGDASIELVTSASGTASAAATGANSTARAGMVSVGVDTGHALVVRAGMEAAAQPHARWLASWIALSSQHATLKHAAYTDALTGAWNRRYCTRFLTRAINEARKARRNVSVMLFDIDNFKMYNDRYGHDAGDEILCETVRLMRTMVRPSDRVCRIGGDEFAVIFYEPHGPRQEGSRHPDSVFAIARRFQQQVTQHRFPKLGSQARGVLTISGGLATFPWDGSSGEELLARADALAMASKRQGKGALTFGPSVV